MKDLKTTTYKSVGYEGYTTIFLPTNKRVEEEYENGKEGDQLWVQLTDDGLITSNYYTEQEVIWGMGASETDNPRDGYKSLIPKLLHEIYLIELSVEELEGKPANKESLAYLMGQKKAFIELIKDLKK